jgi:hypothetical protein
VNVSNLSGAYNTTGSLGNALYTNRTAPNAKYVSLDLSGSTFNSIGDRAFQGCSNLTSITILNNVTSIGNNAFLSCSSLTSITIPDSVTSIGDRAFNSCTSFMAINVDGSNTAYSSVDGILFNKGITQLIQCPAKKTGAVTIPSSVTSIEHYAFYDCSSLTSVTIGNSVTSIGNNAFRTCSSLTSVTIPDSVTSIGSFAFYRCSSLASVTIPNNVTSIATSTFDGCSSLTSVTIPDSVTSIGNYAFDVCTRITSVTFAQGNNITANFGTRAFINPANTTALQDLYNAETKPLATAVTFTRPDTTSTTWTKE